MILQIVAVMIFAESKAFCFKTLDFDDFSINSEKIVYFHKIENVRKMTSEIDKRNDIELLLALFQSVIVKRSHQFHDVIRNFTNTLRYLLENNLQLLNLMTHMDFVLPILGN